MKHKRQHIVPSCYLSAWLEPVAPTGQQRALWKFAKDGSGGHRRSPQKTFVQSDRYTVFLKDGGRDLKVEHSLDKIENDFSGVFRRLHRNEKLTLLDKAKLAIFTAAMLGRTTQRADHWKDSWKDIRKIVSQFEGDGGTRKASGSLTEGMPLPPGAARISSSEIDDFLVNAHPEHLINTIEVAGPILFSMDLSIYSTDDKYGFLTSDDPCIMHNPTAYRYHPMRRSPGLGQRDVEILLPISPRLLIAFTHTRTYPYITPMPKKAVDEFNRMMVWQSASEFVSWTGQLCEEWFEKPGPAPPDAWENRSRDTWTPQSESGPDFLEHFDFQESPALIPDEDQG